MLPLSRQTASQQSCPDPGKHPASGLQTLGSLWQALQQQDCQNIVIRVMSQILG